MAFIDISFVAYSNQSVNNWMNTFSLFFSKGKQWKFCQLTTTAPATATARCKCGFTTGKRQQKSLLILSLPLSTGCVESFTHTGPWPLVWHSPGRVCGCHGEPVCSPEHHNFGHCQFSAERQQGAGSVQLQHGLHPDRCCNRCECHA